jgi:hypothetical protein
VAVPSGPQLHRASTRAFSVVIVALGVAMLVITLVAGGGVLAKGVLLGLLFVAVGAGRLYLLGRR